VRDRLLDTARRSGLLVAGVGSGLTAAAAAKGGADLLACYATACHRVMGLPSAMSFLPYADANQLTLSALPDVVAASDVPVIAGIGAHDPRRDLARLIGAVVDRGAVGVTNEPFIGMYAGDLRDQLEAAGLGFERELALVRRAERDGLFTLGWAWSPDDARQMVQAGASAIGAMLGVSAGGTLGSSPAHDLDTGIELLAAMVEAARAEDPQSVVLVHGGPLHDPTSVATALRATGADGYVAGSTLERTPALRGIADAAQQFKAEITLERGEPDE
jgi:predicted TIM-barrel enzyme